LVFLFIFIHPTFASISPVLENVEHGKELPFALILLLLVLNFCIGSLQMMFAFLFQLDQNFSVSEGMQVLGFRRLYMQKKEYCITCELFTQFSASA
jgi:hypothetical protein